MASLKVDFGGTCDCPEVCPLAKQVHSVFQWGVQDVRTGKEAASSTGSDSWEKAAALGPVPQGWRRKAMVAAQAGAPSRAKSGGGRGAGLAA